MSTTHLAPTFHNEAHIYDQLTGFISKKTLKPLIRNVPLVAPAFMVMDILNKVGDLTPTPRTIVRQAVTHNGWHGAWFYPKNCHSNQVLYYIHGGGYLSGGLGTHKRLIEALAEQHNTPVFAIVYRRYPTVRLDEMVSDCMEGLEYLQEFGYKPHEITVIGDSAGGGLTARVVGDALQSDTLLKGAVMLSPWLDFSIDQADYAAFQMQDAFIPASRLPQVAKLILGRDPEPNDSPLTRLVEGYPPILLITGQNEALRVDTERAYERSLDLSIPCDVHYYQGCHAFPVFSQTNRQGKSALQEIGRFIHRDD